MSCGGRVAAPKLTTKDRREEFDDARCIGRARACRCGVRRHVQRAARAISGGLLQRTRGRLHRGRRCRRWVRSGLTGGFLTSFVPLASTSVARSPSGFSPFSQPTPRKRRSNLCSSPLSPVHIVHPRIREVALANGEAGNAAIVALGLKNRSHAASGWHDPRRFESSRPGGGPVQMQAVTIDTTALSVERRNSLKGAL